MYYNSAKGGVDSFDRMCAEDSVSRKTCRWPVCTFYGLVNITMNNSWIIHKHRRRQNNENKFVFFHDLAMALCKPHVQVRLDHHRYFSQDLKYLIKITFGLEPQDRQDIVPGQEFSDTARRCAFCPKGKDRKDSKYKAICKDCRRTHCRQHSITLCLECANTRYRPWRSTCIIFVHLFVCTFKRERERERERNILYI